MAMIALRRVAHAKTASEAAQQFAAAALQADGDREKSTSPELVQTLNALFEPAQHGESWAREVHDLLDAGQCGLAVARCDAELRVHRSSALALFLRGAARLELGRYGLGLSDLTRAVGLDLRFARLAETLGGRESN